MIGIINCGVGNLLSVTNALTYLSYESLLIDDAKMLENVDALILPGVGNFKHGIQALKNINIIDELNEQVLIKRKPILGICLGMQLMCSYSEEGDMSGLGWFDADVKKIRSKLIRVPNMGWSDVEIIGGNLFKDMQEAAFYFLHSYYVDGKHNNCTSFIKSDLCIAASLQNENIHAVQFHPEKSQQGGLKVLSNFLETL